MSETLGIVGAGKLGIALAKVGVAAGYDVVLTSSNVETTRLIAEVMAPGSRVGTLNEVAAQADIVVLAVPLHRFRELPAHIFDGMVVVDAINYWQPVDGEIARFGVEAATTSELVRAHFSGALLVKSLNQLGYHDVEDGRRPKGAPDRLGVALAGDNDEALKIVRGLVDKLGFDPVDAGSLTDGAMLGPGGAAFGATLSVRQLREALGLTTLSARQ